MVNWQVTATTIYCNAVDDEVTLMVSKDWSVKCSGFDRYREADRETAKIMKRRSKRLNRKLECEGLECSRVTHYKEKLSTEEAAKSSGEEIVEPHQG